MYQQRTFRIISTFAFCNVLAWSTSPYLGTRGGLRALTSSNTTTTAAAAAVECSYVQKIISYADNKDETVHMCVTEDDGFAHNLPKEVSVTDSFVSGRTILKLHGARIKKDAHGHTNIEVPSNMKVEVKERQQQQSGGRRLGSTKGKHIVLAIRLTSLDGQVVNSRSTIGKLIFGDNVTLKSMYQSCSFGKLTMAPYKGKGVVNGVAELFVNMTVNGVSSQVVENEVMGQIRTLYGEEGIAYDHLMIMMPPGTWGSSANGNGNWLAYGQIGAFRTCFNNDWSGYSSSHIHEIGHNLGLYHSDKDGVEYSDTSGLMGYSTPAVAFPSKCFNGHKNYILGWFSDKTVELSTSSLPWTGNLASFVDYNKAKSDEPVLIKVNDLFLQYNEAKSFNFQTQQSLNAITITQGPNSTTDSNSVGAVSMSNKLYEDATSNLNIEVCGQTFGSNGLADKYRVSIYMDQQTSGCDPNNIHRKSLVPTHAPTTYATGNTKVPPPTQAPVSSNFIPDTCKDNTTATFYAVDSSTGIATFQTCAWLSTQSSTVKQTSCNPQFPLGAYNVCPSTCGKCHHPCPDATSRVSINGRQRTCRYLASHSELQATACQPDQPAFSLCRQTCNSCFATFPPDAATQPTKKQETAHSTAVPSQQQQQLKKKRTKVTTAPTSAPTILDFFPLSNDFPTAQPQLRRATAAPSPLPTILDFWPSANNFPTSQPHQRVLTTTKLAADDAPSPTSAPTSVLAVAPLPPNFQMVQDSSPTTAPTSILGVVPLPTSQPNAST